MTYSVLVVDVDRNALSEASAALADAGYQVTEASSFADARQRLVLSKPDLLVTAVRLAGFNGLHLIVRSKTALPDMVAVLTHAVPDPALQADAAAHDAIFIVKPVDWTMLVNVVNSALAARGDRPKTSRPRRWRRRMPADRVDATLGETLATVVDLSYGGVRLQLRARAGDRTGLAQTLALPSAGIAVHARPVWTHASGPDGPWLCGLEVQEPDPRVDRAWRAWVDAVGLAPPR